MGSDCDEFICSKDDTAIMQQIAEKGKQAGISNIRRYDSRAKYLYKGPLNSVLLGQHTWPILHTISMWYPENPTDTDKQRFTKFINSFSKVYPWNIWATDFRHQISITPPKLDSRKDFALWLCDQHNRVNKKLGKPEFKWSYGKLIALYKPKTKFKADKIV